MEGGCIKSNEKPERETTGNRLKRLCSPLFFWPISFAVYGNRLRISPRSTGMKLINKTIRYYFTVKFTKRLKHFNMFQLGADRPILL